MKNLTIYKTSLLRRGEGDEAPDLKPSPLENRRCFVALSIAGVY
ncbi:MAG: hypothetical protein R2820_12400 [Cyclobacteriaceae bacterium]